MGDLLQCQNLRVKRGDRCILHGINLTLAAGQMVGVIGPNGSGKSTLLRALSGEWECEGSVRVMDSPAGQLTVKELARRRAVMPQHHSFPFAYLVDDVVRMGRFCWSSSAQEDDLIVSIAMERTDTVELRYREVTGLSGGEGARVTFARVLAQDTPLVLLDEPTAAFDIAHQERTMSQCRRLADGGSAVLVIVHDIELAAAYCHRLVLLHRGRVEAAGTPREVLTDERLSRVYGWPIKVDSDRETIRITPVRDLHIVRG